MATTTNNYTNNPSPIALGRIKFDMNQINSEKDIIANEGIYFNFSEDKQINTVYHKLIIGPEDSPYQGGFYAFQGQFPNNYPFTPMTMKTLTQGENVRKHPNLYVCGKCCFSFLGTWSGPPWTPCNNPRSVAISMRSVMTKFPLENEPSYEDITQKKILHQKYADLIKWFNIKHAVYGVLCKIDEEPYSYFKKDIISVFIKNIAYYNSVLESLFTYPDKLRKKYAMEETNNLQNNSILTKDDIYKKYTNMPVLEEKSPVYRFSIKYNVDEVYTKLNILYKKYSDAPIIKNIQEIESSGQNLEDSSVISPKDITVNTINVVNNLEQDNHDTSIIVNETQTVKTHNVKKQYIKKTPKKKASLFEEGYTLVSENDNCMYKVISIKNGKRWKKII